MKFVCTKGFGRGEGSNDGKSVALIRSISGTVEARSLVGIFIGHLNSSAAIAAVLGDGDQTVGEPRRGVGAVRDEHGCRAHKVLLDPRRSASDWLVLGWPGLRQMLRGSNFGRIGSHPVALLLSTTGRLNTWNWHGIDNARLNGPPIHRLSRQLRLSPPAATPTAACRRCARTPG